MATQGIPQTIQRAVGSLLLLGGSFHLRAQERPRVEVNPEEPPDRLEALLNTPVEAASRREQRAMDSPQAIEVLTADQIRASGVFRLVDALRLLTNVQVYDVGKEVSRLTLRGTASSGQMRNVQLLVDGIPLFNTEANATDFALLPIPVDAIERVEVVRGPSSSLYGANAQAGVISITTKRGKEGLSGGLRVGAANAGTFESQGMVGYGANGFSLSAGFGSSSQGDSGLSQRVLGGTRRVDPQDQSHASQVFLRPEADLGEGRIWAFYSHAANRSGPQLVETPAGVPVYQSAFLGDSAETAQVGWSQGWSSEFRTDLKVNHTRLRAVTLAPLEVVPGSPTSAALVPVLLTLDPALNSVDDVLDSTHDQVVFQGNWNPTPAVHVVFGGDAARMKARKALIVGLQADREDSASGGFLSVDWTLGPAILSLGARLENETLGGSRTSPRLALVVGLPDGSVVRAGYYTATRSPQVAELVQDIRIPGRSAATGNPALKPEAFDSFELGYRRAWTAWSLDLTAYQMRLKKAVIVEPTGLMVGGFPQTEFQNSGEALWNKGVELSLKGELGLGWFLGFNAATVDFKDASGQEQYFAPEITANLWSSFHHGGFQAYVALQHMGGYRMTNQTNLAGPSEDRPPMDQLHVNVGYEWSRRLQVSLYGINALRPSDETTPGATNNAHLVWFQRREMGLQASYRF